MTRKGFAAMQNALDLVRCNYELAYCLARKKMRILELSVVAWPACVVARSPGIDGG